MILAIRDADWTNSSPSPSQTQSSGGWLNLRVGHHEGIECDKTITVPDVVEYKRIVGKLFFLLLNGGIQDK